MGRCLYFVCAHFVGGKALFPKRVVASTDPYNVQKMLLGQEQLSIHIQ